MGYELLDHTGDLAIVVREPTAEAVYVTAARAMFELMVGKTEPGDAETTLKSEGEDEADLLQKFLSDLLFHFCAEDTIVTIDSVEVADGKLTARGRARPFDASRDELETELKAVTYHQLEMRREGDGWFAQVIFDV